MNFKNFLSETTDFKKFMYDWWGTRDQSELDLEDQHSLIEHFYEELANHISRDLGTLGIKFPRNFKPDNTKNFHTKFAREPLYINLAGDVSRYSDSYIQKSQGTFQEIAWWFLWEDKHDSPLKPGDFVSRWGLNVLDAEKIINRLYSKWGKFQYKNNMEAQFRERSAPKKAQVPPPPGSKIGVIAPKRS